MTSPRWLLAVCMLAHGFFASLHAQVSYSGGTYAQDFDTLPAAGTFTLVGSGPIALTDAPISASGLAGWSLANPGNTARFLVSAGTSTTGGAFSFGTAGITDRALGSLGSGTAASRFGVTLINDTGATITTFTLACTGEQWRRGSGVANILTFDYGLGATNIVAGTFVLVPALDFMAPVTTGTNAALDGNLPANQVDLATTVNGIAWLPGQTLILRWSDVDNAGSDDGLGIDDLIFTTTATTVLPAVTSTTPAAGATNVATTGPIMVTFNQPVVVSGSWFSITGSTSGVISAAVSGGPTNFALTPLAPLAEGETVTVTIFASQVSDAATGTLHLAADFSFSFATLSTAPLPIHTIQGSGATSPFTGQVVTIEGVVTASFQGTSGLGGFYVQAAPGAEDADPATSEGVFVFNNTFTVSAGSLVRVTGTVLEFGGAGVTETELSSVTSVTTTGMAALPAPVEVALPFAAPDAGERYEGMRVTLPQTLTVTDTFDLGHFGEFFLSLGRLPNPTNIVAPGAPAIAQQVANGLNQILVDDGTSATYPDPTPYLADSAGRGATRRSGSTVTGLGGIFDQKFGSYVIEPTAPVAFEDENPRGDVPLVGGSLRVAIGNVLNFFNGDGLGGGFPTSRGADTPAEFARQRAKIIAGITALAPDIMGLTEIENDGYGPASALADLVAGVNASAPVGTTYAFVDASAANVGTDEIRVALIYRTQTVALVGAPVTLNNPYFDGLARPPLAQTFRERSSGEMLTVCINHFKSKGSASTGAAATDGITPNPNLDQGDGQGQSNYLRKREAQTLMQWLATDPTGSGDPDTLIIGDLNAYAQEDPIIAIKLAGYFNLTEEFEGAGGYSYAFNGEFGHLDHALASPHLFLQVLSAATWHANADEPVYYDYNTENKNAAQQAINTGTAYRYSDHDPVVVGLNLSPDPEAPLITTQPSPQTVALGATATFTVAASGFPAPTFQWSKDGTPIAGATAPTLTLTNVTLGDVGSYRATATNVVGSATSDAAALTIADTTAPVIASLRASPFILWPANNRLISVNLTAVVTDDIDPNPTTRIINVTANETIVAGTDWQITGDLTLNLRASQGGHGFGRLYTVTVESVDAAGNASQKDVRVLVPKNAFIALFYWLFVVLTS